MDSNLATKRLKYGDSEGRWLRQIMNVHHKSNGAKIEKFTGHLTRIYSIIVFGVAARFCEFEEQGETSVVWVLMISHLGYKGIRFISEQTQYIVNVFKTTVNIFHSVIPPISNSNLMRSLLLRSCFVQTWKLRSLWSFQFQMNVHLRRLREGALEPKDKENLLEVN